MCIAPVPLRLGPSVGCALLPISVPVSVRSGGAFLVDGIGLGMGVQGFKVLRECLGPGDLVTWCHCEWSLGFWVCGVCGGWASGLVSLESLFVLGLGGMIAVLLSVRVKVYLTWVEGTMGMAATNNLCRHN